MATEYKSRNIKLTPNEKIVEDEMVELLQHFTIHAPNTGHQLEFSIYEGCFVINDYSGTLKKKYVRFKNAIGYLYEND